MNQPKKYCILRFYGNLNDFLRPEIRQLSFSHYYSGNPTVKDIIESNGVPHSEVFLVVINGEIVNFDFHPPAESRIACYPNFSSIDIKGASLLNKQVGEMRFILDVHLGKLAKYLRIIGFDTLYSTTYKDDEIIQISNAEKRIILTRDKGILKNGKTHLGYFLRNTDPTHQLKELIDHFRLEEKARPFSRCSLCNGIVEEVDKRKVEYKLLINTINYFEIFFQCQNCKQVYWEGSHFDRLKRFIKDSLNDKNESNTLDSNHI